MFIYLSNTSTTKIFTLSLHDALPIFLFSFFIQIYNAWYRHGGFTVQFSFLLKFSSKIFTCWGAYIFFYGSHYYAIGLRSEEHTSELQSREKLVYRLLLEKKKLNT